MTTVTPEMTPAPEAALAPVVEMSDEQKLEAYKLHLIDLYTQGDFDAVAPVQQAFNELRAKMVAAAQLLTIRQDLAFLTPKGDGMQALKTKMVDHKLDSFTISYSLANADAMPLVVVNLGQTAAARANGSGQSSKSARTVEVFVDGKVIYTAPLRQAEKERGQGGVVTAATKGLGNRQTAAQYVRQEGAKGYKVRLTPDFDDPVSTA